MLYSSKRLANLLIFIVLSISCFGQQQLVQNLTALQKQLVPDKRVALLDISVNDTIRPTVVKGETNLPNAKQLIADFFVKNDFKVTDSIRLLPDEAVEEKTWALATLSVSNVRSKPDDASELVSQVVMGTPMKILDIKNKWYRIQTPEKYIGWIDAAELQPLSANEMDRWKTSNRYLFNHVFGVVYSEPNKRSELVSDMVLNGMFEAVSEEKGFLKITLPDGRKGFVRKSDCISFRDWSQQKLNVKEVVAVAKQMMGFPYLWGGTSSKAADCSGFVKLAFYSQGIILARDASQQARYGEVIDIANPSNLQPGDLLFFGRSAQRITHVGIYMGNGDFIHSSGKVHIASIDPNSAKFNPSRNFVAARRIATRLGTEGIEKAADHPWYK